MKKCILVLSLLFSMSGLISCQAELSQAFELTLQNDHLILVNATSRSCALQIGDPGHTQGNDLKEMFASIGRFTINWTGANNLRIQYIQITFEGPAFAKGKFALPAIAGDDLAYAFSGSVALEEIPSGTTKTSTGDCTFSVGGIKLTDMTKSAFGQGTFLVYATTTDSDGQTSAAYASVPFNYEYFAP